MVGESSFVDEPGPFYEYLHIFPRILVCVANSELVMPVDASELVMPVDAVSSICG